MNERIDELKVKMDLDVLLRRLSDATRLLPALTADNAAAERSRLAGCLRRREEAKPAWMARARSVDPEVGDWLAQARSLAPSAPGCELYRRRLDEIELDLEILQALGDARRIPRLAARRFGTGAMRVATDHGVMPLARVARAMLDAVEDTPEPRVLSADDPSPGDVSVAGLMRRLARHAGLEVRVGVEPRLAAAAAAGERIVLLADRRFGRREGLRLAVHEVLGHLVSAANGRAQPLRVIELGTAGSFADQEGLAILLEERADLLDGRRLRTLAARVVAADCMHAGATFDETCRELMDDLGFDPMDAVSIAERAYRGGGVARDVGYLAGWLRVRRAVARGEAAIDELRMGRVSLDELPTLRRLAAEGWARPAVYRPSLSRSLRATHFGTRLSMSPPREAASLTRFEAT